jgi:hypothetical protein
MIQSPPRAVALHAIGRRGGGAQILAFLQDRVVNDPTPRIRAAALQAIAQLRSSRIVPGLVEASARFQGVAGQRRMEV